ncbi:MAG: DUF3857 domain-containing protein [Bacteroidia bacterium]
MNVKKLLAIGLITMCSVSAMAQSASERRKAQQKTSALEKDFDMSDPIFKKKEIPEEWKDRSAIILGERIEFTYGIENSSRFEGKVRKQFLLLDKSAVEDFGTFVFNDSESGRTGIQIIKADGSTKLVDMSEAVGIDEESSSRKSMFSSYEQRKYDSKKIALSGLEVGDIIDYVVVSKGDFGLMWLPSCSYLLEIPFKAEYPVLEKSIQITLKRGYYINAVSTNGAPKLRAVSDASNARIQTYALTAKMMDDEGVAGYIFTHKVVPQLRVQVCYAKKNQYNETFIGDMGSVKSKVGPDEVQRAIGFKRAFLVNGRSAKVGGTTYIMSGYKSEINNYRMWAIRYLKKETDPIKVADALYFKIRYDYFFGDYQGASSRLDDELSAVLLSEVLRQLKMPAEIVVVPGKDRSSWENLISNYELYWVVRVKTPKQTKYYYPIGMHRMPDDGFWRLDGQKGQIYEFDTKLNNPSKYHPNYKYKFVEMPASPANENKIVYKADVKIQEDYSLRLTTMNTYSGQAKYIGFGYALLNEDLAKAEKKHLERYEGVKTEKVSDKRKAGQKAKVDEFDREENARKKQEILENRLKRNYSFKEFNSFELVSDGRLPKTPNLEFKQDYEIEDVVTRAGNNLVLEAGKLIGKYSKVDTTKERKYDIMYDYPMEIDWEYRIEIPAGYQVEGLQNLHVNVNNATGIFESKASVEGNILKIEIKRNYLQNYMPATSWLDFAAFLNAADDFSQRKLVLKKI